MPALKCEKERKLKEKKLKNEEGHVTTGKKLACSVGMKGSQSGQYVQEKEGCGEDWDGKLGRTLSGHVTEAWEPLEHAM